MNQLNTNVNQRDQPFLFNAFKSKFRIAIFITKEIY